MKTFQVIKSQWDSQKADKMSELEQLVYRSNILGNDQSITNTGGGNTSAKIMEKDPVTGEVVEVLWVKGSGGDLRTSKKENFSSLYLNKIHQLKNVYDRFEQKGIKTPAEDAMVGYYQHCNFNLNPRVSSIDTPLHALINKKHIDHMHATAVIAIAACDQQEKLVQEIWGGDMFYVPWMRPGWELALKLQEGFEKNPRAIGALMGQHGFISWGDTSKECYDNTLRLINQAQEYLATKDLGADTFGGQKYLDLSEDKKKAVLQEVLPFIRGKIAQPKKQIATIQYDELVMSYINSFDCQKLSALGTSCPDHFLRTKIKPLYLEWDPAKEDVAQLKIKLEAGLKAYQEDYRQYYEKNKEADSPAIRNAYPTVMAIPGIGLIGWGKNKSESRVTTEFYRTAIEVMKGAESIGSYQGISAKEAFDIEYWALEEAKLKRMPPENEFSRDVVVVIGAGSGIGKEVASSIATEGAHVICADKSLEASQGTCQELESKYGKGIGVAGSGISSCGNFLGLSVDITNEESLNQFFARVMEAYGGIDHVVVTAGVFIPPGADQKLSDAQWDLTFAVNVKGAYLVAQAAKDVWQKQQLKGSLVLTTSVNGVVPKKGSIAYDTSKAAANHLVRELAVELAPLIRVNACAPATVIQGSSMFSRERVLSSLKKYEIQYAEDEATESLVDKLANFYASRTLLKTPITPQDQADVIKTLCSKSFSQSTGQIISVDGGLLEAFLR